VAEALTPPPPPQPQPEPETFRRRFRVVYFLLAAALGAAAATFVLLLLRPAPEPPPAWSAWEPAGSPDEKIEQIRQYVYGRYRFPSGDVLVSVRATPPAADGQPLAAFLIASATGFESAVEDVVPAGSGLMYTLCGAGQGCAITNGNPTAERFRALRREALELALYTFRYVDEVESVAVFLPPTFEPDPNRRGRLRRATPYMLFFQRDGLAPALDAPIGATLRRQGYIVVPGPVDPSESRVVDRITARALYEFQVREDANGEALLLLARPS
jgi:hypothetical protein